MTISNRRHRPFLAVLTTLAALGVLASTAAAATPAVTTQAAAANAGFLAYAPPPADGAGALCLVDTGVHPNPDTSPGLIGSYAIDTGTTDDVDPQGHGTIDAMIAGAAGNGMIGAWPQLKIVSVRATNVPSPGQEPSFEFDNYWQAMDRCFDESQDGDPIKAVDLPLSSQIPPTPDQAQSFSTAVTELESSNIAVVAAAGNQPGPAEEPAVEPNVFAIGAFTAQTGSVSPTAAGQVCSFSADQGLTFYGPGCGLDQADPFTDAATCCGDGTSQASAFTSAVIVALMSYDPALTYAAAERLLVQTATNGALNVAAAFTADGLGNIVAAGNAAIPQPAPAPVPTPTPAPTPRTWPVSLVSINWANDAVVIKLTGAMPKTGTLYATLHYPNGKTRRVAKPFKRRKHHKTGKPYTIKLHTREPAAVTARLWRGHTAYDLPIAASFHIWPVSLVSIGWHADTLKLKLAGMPRRAVLHAMLRYPHSKHVRKVIVDYKRARHHKHGKPATIKIHTSEPSRITFRIWLGHKAFDAKTTHRFKTATRTQVAADGYTIVQDLR